MKTFTEAEVKEMIAAAVKEATAKPVVAPEPRHPSTDEDVRQRMSLYDALRKERDLMNEVSKDKGLNPTEASACKMVSFALNHIIEMWNGNVVRVEYDPSDRTFSHIRSTE